MRQLIAALPEKTGLALVILQHLPPSQTGKLARALASVTSLPVIDAVNGHRVAPNTIVVVPPRTSAELVRGALVLRVAKGGARPQQPIDGLFSSLATALGTRAIGVVLSGSANDGSAGLRDIREASRSRRKIRRRRAHTAVSASGSPSFATSSRVRPERSTRRASRAREPRSPCDFRRRLARDRTARRAAAVVLDGERYRGPHLPCRLFDLGAIATE